MAPTFGSEGDSGKGVSSAFLTCRVQVGSSPAPWPGLPSPPPAPTPSRDTWRL